MTVRILFIWSDEILNDYTNLREPITLIDTSLPLAFASQTPVEISNRKGLDFSAY